MKKIAAVLFISLLFSACGDKADVSKASSGIEGVFKISNGKDAFAFTMEGEVTSKHPLFPSKVTKYQKNNSELVFQFKEGYPMKFTIINESTLKSESGENFIKQ